MCRIVIADDEMLERMALRKTIRRHFGDDCEIYEATNGREALEIHRDKQVQIAVLDIEMPGINGIQAAEKIRKTDPACAIIFLTAYDEFSYAQKAIKVRAMAYLLKPHQEEEFVAVLEEAMHLQKEKSQQEGEFATPQDSVQELDFSAEQEETGENGRAILVSKWIRDYIEAHYMEELSMQDVARAMNYSDAYFCKLFKQCFACNFTSYLTKFRIEQAKQLLLSPSANVKEIGEAVGYGDSNYFAKVFRRYTGYSPTEYRAELLKK